MEYLTDTREIIIALKQVYEDKELSLDKVIKIVESKYGKNAVSRSTVQRLFKPGSEDNPANFRYETTLIPLCNSLLNTNDGETNDLLMRFKKDLIEEYAALVKDLKEEIRTIKEHERAKYANQLEKETKHFNNSLAFMTHQITLKDQRIDALISLNTELTQTNNSLVKQLMDCPLRVKE